MIYSMHMLIHFHPCAHGPTEREREKVREGDIICAEMFKHVRVFEFLGRPGQ